MSKGWIGVDLDGTLATYDKWVDAHVIGEPVLPMVERVKRWLNEGHNVCIFTARMWPYLVVTPGTSEYMWPRLMEVDAKRTLQARNAIAAINAWVYEHIGRNLTITCVKDLHMIELWDDRAVQVERNIGEPVGYSPNNL